MVTTVEGGGFGLPATGVVGFKFKVAGIEGEEEGAMGPIGAGEFRVAVLLFPEELLVAVTPFVEVLVTSPAELERVIKRVLEKDPFRRYQTADEMRAALAEVPVTRKPAVSIPALKAESQRPVIYSDKNPGIERKRTASRTKPANLPEVTRRPRRAFLLPLLLIPVLLLMIGLVVLFNSGLLAGSETRPPQTAVAAIFATPVSASPALTTVPATPAAKVGLSTPAAGLTSEPGETATSTTGTNYEIAFTPASSPAPPETATPEATSTLEPTATPEPLSTATQEPTATIKPAPTATPKPVAKATPQPTKAPLNPTATLAPPKPAPTVGKASGPFVSVSGKLNPYLLQGSYKRPDGTLYGRSEIALYGSGSGYNEGQLKFNVNALPSSNAAILLTGLDDERVEHCNLQIILNGILIFDAANSFPNVPNTDNGEGGADRYWGQSRVIFAPNILRSGENSLVLRNTTPWAGYLGIPYILINSVEIITAS